MKTENLQELLTSGKDNKAIIDEIMRLNGEDIKNARDTFKVDTTKYVDIEKYNTLLAERDRLKNDFASVNKEFGAYKDSVKDYDDIKTKYNDLVKETEFNNKINVLNKLNCKHSDLLVDKLDWAKYDNEKKAFEEDYLKGVKTKYSDLFSDIKETEYRPQERISLNSYDKDSSKMTNEDLQKL